MQSILDFQLIVLVHAHHSLMREMRMKQNSLVVGLNTKTMS